MEVVRNGMRKPLIGSKDAPTEGTFGRLTIGELSERAHVNRETVRYYERLRLLPRPSRSASGYRVFADDAVRRLRFIRQAQELGFSLNEIRELLALRVRSVDTCDQVREKAEAKITDIKHKIESLRRMKQALAELVSECSRRGRTKECPILDSLEANGWFEHHKGGDNG